MKIIFDSKEQMQKFTDNVCPSQLGYARRNSKECYITSCEKCLSEYIEMEVKAVEHE